MVKLFSPRKDIFMAQLSKKQNPIAEKSGPSVFAAKIQSMK
jgi:hypothetical protein